MLVLMAQFAGDAPESGTAHLELQIGLPDKAGKRQILFEVGKSPLSCHCPPLSHGSSCEKSNAKCGTFTCRMEGFLLADGP